ncbi:OLC1v1002263C1 [Oldenlandia corymbosa var. corymbosa]|uniref:OLC1v1002263C1 n=1 Tax=Oldenlandia corymbosa var. corymbosa TaxID=529605 RepID=A0AAV1D9K1_OLDCO|nr:OLC1v1002263C1 [Oldenlandia corymbosa var. corymbosa]
MIRLQFTLPGGKTLVGLSALNSAYTSSGSSVRVGPQSTLFRGPNTTLHHAGPQSTVFRGPPLTSQPRSHFGGASIGASIRPEAVASLSGTSRRSKVSTEKTDDWVVTDDVPGGPCDGSVIPSFLGHTAYQLWNGEPRDYLTMKPVKKSLSRLHGWYARLPENAQLQIQNIEAEILKMQVARLLGMPVAELKRAWSYGSVSDILIEECCRRVLPAVQVQAWVWILLASTLFLDRSGGRISASLMNELHGGIDNIAEYSSGSGTLAFLYCQLGIASRAGCTTMAGCMTLLQAWIYEYFSCFQPPRGGDVEVEWKPFGCEQAAAYPSTIFNGWIMYHDFQEPYMSERVLHQLGYVQYIPRAPLTPVTQFRGKNAHKYFVDRPIAETCNCWVRFLESKCIRLSHCVPVSSTEVGQAVVDYPDWYKSHSHPFLLPESVPSTSRIPGKNCTTYWMREMERLTRGCIDDLKKLDMGLGEEWDTRLDDVIFHHSQAP